MVCLEIIIGGSLALISILVLYRKWAHGYWARKGVPYLEPTLFWGNIENPLTAKTGLKFDLKKAYDEFKLRGHKHGGIFLTSDPTWIPVDLDLIKNVLHKDFQHFQGHGLSSNAEKDPLSAHIFNLDGEEWKYIRAKISPTFTSGKMKMMFETLLDCGVPMIEHIENLQRNGKSLNVKEILASYTIDVIGSCAFGLECNTFKNPHSEFRKYGLKVFEPSLANVFKLLMAFTFPIIRKLVYFRMVPVEVETFFVGTIRDIFDYRKTNNVKRNDFIQMFMEMQEKAERTGERSLTLHQITAQGFLFFLGGFETSSATMTLCLHELAFNQNIQDKLRDEVRESMERNGGKLTYDGIMEMKYMDQVVTETLRKYPVVPFVMRVCTKDYKVGDGDLTIVKDTKVFISTLGIHRDPEFYPNPDKFDPERFTAESKSKIPQYAYIPFGEGPRICIGLRFGLMQTKTGLSMLLDKYKFTPSAGDKYDIEFDPRSFNLCKRGNLLLNAEKLR